MKRIFGLLALALLISGGSSVQADILGFDNFDYADGSLTSNAAWTDHSGTALQMQVENGQAVVVMDGSLSEDANMLFTASPGGIVYYGLDFTVDDLGTPYAGTDNEYFAHFKVDGANDFSARLDIVAAQAGGDFSVGIASDESTADTIWGSDLNYGQTYRAIVGYNQDTNQAQLWIDATTMSDTSILGEDRADPGDSVDSFALRQSNSAGGETIRVDNLVIANDFDSVLTAVPEPSSALVLGLGALALGFRRRR